MSRRLDHQKRYRRELAEDGTCSERDASRYVRRSPPTVGKSPPPAVFAEHVLFGRGQVLRQINDGPEPTYEVHFADRFGKRIIAASFLTFEKVTARRDSTARFEAHKAALASEDAAVARAIALNQEALRAPPAALEQAHGWQFPTALRTARVARGLTQQALGAALRPPVAADTIGLWESAGARARRPDPDALRALCVALGLSSDALLGLVTTC